MQFILFVYYFTNPFIDVCCLILWPWNLSWPCNCFTNITLQKWHYGTSKARSWEAYGFCPDLSDIVYRVLRPYAKETLWWSPELRQRGTQLSRDSSSSCQSAGHVSEAILDSPGPSSVSPKWLWLMPWEVKESLHSPLWILENFGYDQMVVVLIYYSGAVYYTAVGIIISFPFSIASSFGGWGDSQSSLKSLMEDGAWPCKGTMCVSVRRGSVFWGTVSIKEKEVKW